MNELHQVFELLKGHYGWSPAVLSWMGLFRAGLKFFSARIQTNLTARMVEAANSADEQDDRDFDSILQARWYRTAQFILDLVFSFKLPTHADFLRAKVPPGAGNNQTQKQTS